MFVKCINFYTNTFNASVPTIHLYPWQLFLDHWQFFLQLSQQKKLSSADSYGMIAHQKHVVSHRELQGHGHRIGWIRFHARPRLVPVHAIVVCVVTNEAILPGHRTENIRDLQIFQVFS